MQRAESLRPILEGKCRFTLNEAVTIAGKSFPSVTVFEDASEVILLFDPDSHLVARRRYSKLDPKGKKTTCEVVYTGYQSVNGLMIPSRIEGYEEGKLRQETDLQQMVLLQDIPDTYFTDPSLVEP